ncbi:hypothetical protein ABIC83_002411 [Roseateles asaccharophilus]|uniref:hypothetical protein n=1 Tax=Roseateles asaccharophilus TaxID=582607 RepID=UPI00383293CB
MTSKLITLARRLVRAEIKVATDPTDREAKSTRKKLWDRFKALSLRLEDAAAPQQLGLSLPAAWGVFHPDGSAHIFQSRETTATFGEPAPLFTHPWQMPPKEALRRLSAESLAAAGFPQSEELQAACLAMMEAAVRAAADPVLGELAKAGRELSSTPA